MTVHFANSTRTYGQATDVPVPFCRPDSVTGYRLTTSFNPADVTCKACLKALSTP